MGLITTHVNDDKKLVTIWLSRDESNSAHREELKPLFAEYKARKYTVAVFQSGTEDLFDNTLALLKHNRTRSAEAEVQQEKSAAIG